MKYKMQKRREWSESGYIVSFIVSKDKKFVNKKLKKLLKKASNAIVLTIDFIFVFCLITKASKTPTNIPDISAAMKNIISPYKFIPTKQWGVFYYSTPKYLIALL